MPLRVGTNMIEDLRFVSDYYELPLEILLRLEDYLCECFPPYNTVTYSKAPDLEFHISRELILSSYPTSAE
jgi:hypothetical protein